MKVFSTLAVALAVALPVLSQSLTGLPSCAQQAILSGIGSTGCALTDFKCVCAAKSFISSLAAELPKVCSAADIAKTDTYALQLCASAGVSLSLPSATGGSSSTAAAPANTASSSSSSSMTSPSPSAPATTTSSATSSSSSSSSSEAANASGTESGSSSASTGAATHVRAGVVGVIAVGMGVVVGL